MIATSRRPNTADSVKQARSEMLEQFKLFARYGVPNPKAEQLTLALVTEAFRPAQMLNSVAKDAAELLRRRDRRVFLLLAS